MQLSSNELIILREIAQYVNQYHQSHCSQVNLILDQNLLNKYVTEIPINWKKIADNLNMTRDKVYHWYFETYLRKMNENKISKQDRVQIKEAIINAIQSRQIEDVTFQQHLKNEVFHNRPIHRVEFSTAFNNILRANDVKELIAKYNIILPNRRNRDVEYEGDQGSMSSSSSVSRGHKTQYVSNFSQQDQDNSIIGEVNMQSSHPLTQQSSSICANPFLIDIFQNQNTNLQEAEIQHTQEQKGSQLMPMLIMKARDDCADFEQFDALGIFQDSSGKPSEDVNNSNPKKLQDDYESTIYCQKDSVVHQIEKSIDTTAVKNRLENYKTQEEKCL